MGRTRVLCGWILGGAVQEYLKMEPETPHKTAEPAGPVKRTACIGCGALLPETGGPTHRYMTSSPACWAAYSEVLEREFGSQDLFQRVHRYTVDTYAVQHPGSPSPQGIQSVAVHLMSLCTLIEGGSTTEWAREIIREAVRIKGRFVWLQPPP